MSDDVLESEGLAIVPTPPGAVIPPRKWLRLKGKRRAVVLALATTRTLSAASREAGVSRSTIYSWMQEPGFREAVGQMRHRFFEEAAELLLAGQAKAVSRLLEGLDSRDPALRLRSATSILELGMDVREGSEMEARLRDLEHRAGLRSDR